MVLIYSAIVFLLGACIGSFLNVVILRTHLGKSLQGRSACPHCQHQLNAADLVPIISFLVLSGKCRYCQHNLSVQYPLVESATALAFVGCFFTSLPLSSWFGLLNLLFAFFIVSVLIVVTVSDLKWGLIPDKVVLPATVVALIYQLILLLLLPNKMIVLWNLLAAAAIGLFFFLTIFLTRGKGMGGGDLKLSVFIGLALGFPQAVIGIILGFLTGAGGSVMLLLLGKKGLKSTIPFGPFLALGAYLALLLGNDIWTAYLRALGF